MFSANVCVIVFVHGCCMSISAVYIWMNWDIHIEFLGIWLDITKYFFPEYEQNISVGNWGVSQEKNPPSGSILDEFDHDLGGFRNVICRQLWTLGELLVKNHGYFTTRFTKKGWELVNPHVIDPGAGFIIPRKFNGWLIEDSSLVVISGAIFGMCSDSTTQKHLKESGV